MDIFLMPDAERVLIIHLNANMTPPVSQSVPNPRPAEFLTVRRIGGPRMNMVADHPMVTVEAWAAGPTAAKTLIAQARGIIHAMRATVVDGVPIYRVTEISGPINLPDPESNQSRYTQTFQVMMRGADA